MNVPKAERPYCNMIVKLSNLMFSVSHRHPSCFVKLDDLVQFLCLSGDDLTLSVSRKKGKDTIMAPSFLGDLLFGF